MPLREIHDDAAGLDTLRSIHVKVDMPGFMSHVTGLTPLQAGW